MTYVMQRPWMFNMLLMAVAMLLFVSWIYAGEYRDLETRMAVGFGSSLFTVAVSDLLGRLMGRKDTKTARSVYALLVFAGLILIGAGQSGAL